MKYTGIPCAACGKKFTAEDDVVVCPECGTPYHRACYKNWPLYYEARMPRAMCGSRPRPLRGLCAAGGAAACPQNKTDGEGYVMCSRCGTVNPAGQERCDPVRLPR